MHIHIYIYIYILYIYNIYIYINQEYNCRCYACYKGRYQNLSGLEEKTFKFAYIKHLLFSAWYDFKKVSILLLTNWFSGIYMIQRSSILSPLHFHLLIKIGNTGITWCIIQSQARKRKKITREKFLIFLWKNSFSDISW